VSYLSVKARFWCRAAEFGGLPERNSGGLLFRTANSQGIERFPRAKKAGLSATSPELWRTTFGEPLKTVTHNRCYRTADPLKPTNHSCAACDPSRHSPECEVPKCQSWHSGTLALWHSTSAGPWHSGTQLGAPSVCVCHAARCIHSPPAPYPSQAGLAVRFSQFFPLRKIFHNGETGAAPYEYIEIGRGPGPTARAVLQPPPGESDWTCVAMEPKMALAIFGPPDVWPRGRLTFSVRQHPTTEPLAPEK
jgi:hypothetical protein